VGKKSQCGQYPIHKTVETKRSVEVITKITEEYKEGLNKCFNGDLPINVAINNHNYIATILFLVAMSPQSMLAKNECGQYPIELLMINEYPNDSIYDLINTHKDCMKRFPGFNVAFARYYEDMLSRFIDMYCIESFDIAYDVYHLITNMVSKSSNDKVAVHCLSCEENYKKTTNKIYGQCDDSSSIMRKINDINEKIDGLSNNIDEKMHDFTERINMVENNIDEIRNERDRFFACDDSIKNQLTQMTELVNSLKSAVIHDHSRT
jgi:hypothetical protein